MRRMILALEFAREAVRLEAAHAERATRTWEDARPPGDTPESLRRAPDPSVIARDLRAMESQIVGMLADAKRLRDYQREDCRLAREWQCLVEADDATR